MYNFRKHIIFYGILFFAFFVLGYFLFLSAPNSFPNNKILQVEFGTSVRGLSLKLKQEHIIRSRVAFEAFVILYGGEKHIAQGDYLFENQTPVYDVARRMSTGDYNIDLVKVTIPEGFTVEQIAEAFSEKLINFNKQEFITDTRAKEGYLFPDTYFFLATDTEAEVLSHMNKNFKKKMEPILKDIASFGKTEKEVIIMASLIEREAKGETDRGVISGILWKRLAVGMPLQVDAAPITYKEKGLPEHPISNPGLLAIVATIHPENSPYLYYLHDKNGIIHYARTFLEHEINISKYLK